LTAATRLRAERRRHDWLEFDMQDRLPPSHSVSLLRAVIVELVRRDEPVLTSHQLGVYLTCYLRDVDHTVRGLAQELNVSKSVITRALDKLGELNLARRRIDPNDRRSVIVERTTEGYALLDHMGRVAAEAAKGMEIEAREMAAGAADGVGTRAIAAD
jgi:DNA-binding MarR family transcriptional regulator